MRYLILYIAASLLIGWGASVRIEKVCGTESNATRVFLMASLWPVAVFTQIGGYLVDHSVPTLDCQKKD